MYNQKDWAIGEKVGIDDTCMRLKVKEDHTSFRRKQWGLRVL